jgi:hypothetical protein
MRLLPGLLPEVKVREMLWEIGAKVSREIGIVGFPQEHCPILLGRTLNLGDTVFDRLFEEIVFNPNHVAEECSGVNIPWILLSLLPRSGLRDTVQDIQASTKVVSNIR